MAEGSGLLELARTGIVKKAKKPSERERLVSREAKDLARRPWGCGAGRGVTASLRGLRRG